MKTINRNPAIATNPTRIETTQWTQHTFHKEFSYMICFQTVHKAW